MKHFPSKISARKQESPTAAFIIILKRRMIFCLTISKSSQASPDLLELPENAGEAKKAIIYVYLNYVHYCQELGVEFMANYYTPKNQSLNPLIRTERPYPIVTVHNYLQKCIDADIFFLNSQEITSDIRIIVIGNVFEWCLKEGQRILKEI